MGMASSQARLLTLTSRLHSIELKAQKIEAEKLRLANDSDAAYNTYLEKLEQTKLVANVLAGDGSLQAVDLTANIIYDYKTLREQYALITKDNKALIPQSVSNNYRNTNSLSAFLSAYGLDSGFTQTIHHEDPNQAYIDQEARYQNDLRNWETYYQGWLQRQADTQAEHDEWVRNKLNYDSDYNFYVQDHDKWLNEEKPAYEQEYAKWLTEDPNITEIKNDTDQDWWVEEDYSLGKEFEEAAKSSSSGAVDGCYGNATGSSHSTSCYAHILAHIIDYNGVSCSSKTYDTTTGIGTSTLSGGGYCDNSETVSSGKTTKEVFKEVSDQLNMGIKPKDDHTFNAAELDNDYKKLVSRYKTDGSLKTMKEWAQDLNYVARNSSVSGYDAVKFSETLIEFQNSLEGSLMTFKQTIFDEAVTVWKRREPQLRPEPTWNQTLGAEPQFTEPLNPKPKMEDYITEPPTLPRDEVVNHTTFNDKNKAQWYINLWYKMEGLNETAKVMESVVHDDASNCDLYIYSCDNIPKSNTTYTTNADWNILENENYMIIPDDKLNDPTWLRNAVVEGYVLIQAFDTTANAFKDTSVSTTTRIDEVPDEKGLKKAEAEYEADMDAINKKDRLYDVQLAKLEPERSAIKEELETLKTVAKDNVDRTFKLFS